MGEGMELRNGFPPEPSLERDAMVTVEGSFWKAGFPIQLLFTEVPLPRLSSRVPSPDEDRAAFEVGDLSNITVQARLNETIGTHCSYRLSIRYRHPRTTN